MNTIRATPFKIVRSILLFGEFFISTIVAVEQDIQHPQRFQNQTVLTNLENGQLEIEIRKWVSHPYPGSVNQWIEQHPKLQQLETLWMVLNAS